MSSPIFDIKVYGVEKRMPFIKNTVDKLCLTNDDVFLDDRPNGGNVFYTAKKALLAKPQFGITHRIVLQDDIEVCNNFKQIASEIIKTHPDKIIALLPHDFYLDMVIDKNKEMASITPYIANDKYVTGCGFILPYQYIQQYLLYAENYCNRNYMCEDQAWFAWAKKNNITILNTAPAIIQHIGDESILFQGKTPIGRTKFYEEYPQANWGSKFIMSI